MKNWQLYLAIFILILLVSIKVKEGNTIPNYATHYDKPSELIKEVQSIIKDEPNYDKNKYQNTRSENQKLEKIRNDLKKVNKYEKEVVLPECNKRRGVIEAKIGEAETQTRLKKEEIAEQNKILETVTTQVENIKKQIKNKQDILSEKLRILQGLVGELVSCNIKLTT